MELDFVQWVIIIVLLLLPIFYELSNAFKYYAKFTLFYGLILTCGLVSLPIVILRPRDVNNYKVCAWFVKNVIQPVFSIKVEVRGQEHVASNSPYIVVCNHQSSLDLFGMMELLPDRCTSLAKREIMYAGPFGLAAWLAGTIFIDRLNPESARGTMDKTVKTIHDKNVKVWIFPEGTRNHEGAMLPFKKGAFHLAVAAQVPILPVVFSSYADFYSKDQKKFGTGKFIATCLPKISTEGLKPENVTDLTEIVRKKMIDVYNETSLESATAKLTNGVK